MPDVTRNTVNVTVTKSQPTNVTIASRERTTSGARRETATVEVTVEGAGGNEVYAVEKFTNLTGVSQILTLQNQFKANSCAVFYNGVLMEKNVDYAEAVDRLSLTILIGLTASDKIEVRYVLQ